MKHKRFLIIAGVVASIVTNVAWAHTSVSIGFGIPGPIVVPSPFYYESAPRIYVSPPPPPVVYRQPRVIYSAPFDYGDERYYDQSRAWHRRQEYWRHHRHHDDDDD